MKVSKLEGAELDYWVAKIEGIDPESPLRQIAVNLGSIPEYSPSTDWSIGGPLIEREKMSIAFNEEELWEASIAVGFKNTKYGRALSYKFAVGPTPLIASMRAIVSSVYGESVDE